MRRRDLACSLSCDLNCPPPSPPPPPSPSPPPDKAKTNPCARNSFSGLETMSITHLPPGSGRFWAVALTMTLFTFAFLALLRREWEAYVRLRHAWLRSARRVELYAAVLRVGRRGVSAPELDGLLRGVFPGEVHAVYAVAKSRVRDKFAPSLRPGMGHRPGHDTH